MTRLEQFNSLVKPLHKKGYSLIPIGQNTKQPPMLERFVSSRFAKVRPDEDLYLSEKGNIFVKRTNRFKWQKYQHRQLSLHTLKKYFVDKNCDLALVTGFNNVVVLDVDIKKGQKVEKKFWEWYGHHEDYLNGTAIQQTPSGGFHIFFKTEKGMRKSKLFVGDDCIGDFQAEGAYVLISPSSGYEFLNSLLDFDPIDLDVNRLGISFNYNATDRNVLINKDLVIPTDVEYEKLEDNNDPLVVYYKAAYWQAVLRGVEKDLLNATEGNRNSTFYNKVYHVARLLDGFGKNYNDLEHLKFLGLQIGLTEQEVNRTFYSAHYAAKTRQRVVLVNDSPKHREWLSSDDSRGKLGVMYDAFEWFVTRLNRTPVGNGILQKQFRQGYLSSAGSQSKLANYCGVSRRTIIRWMATWIDNGWCRKVEEDNKWCWIFGEIIEGGERLYIDEPLNKIEIPMVIDISNLKIEK